MLLTRPRRGKSPFITGIRENLITTRHKRGYMLNCAKENVLIIKSRGPLLIAFIFILDLDQLLSDFFVDVPDLLFLC